MFTTTKSEDRWLFYGLLAIILWAPIPFGSNRAWAWSILEIMVFSLFLAWYIQFGKQLNVAYLKPYRPLLYIIGLTQLWVVIQLIPLPMAFLEVIAPNIHAIYETVNVDYAPLSLDPTRTEIYLIKGIAYLMCMFLTLV